MPGERLCLGWNLVHLHVVSPLASRSQVLPKFVEK